ncbi:MAG: polysaccharide deacetylase family protein [bacterium]
MRRKLKQAFYLFQKIISGVLYPFCVLLGYIPKDQAITVLMYHKVSSAPPESTEVRYDNVFPGQFADQLKYLHENGYNVVSLDNYLSWHSGEKKLPRKSVVITFDDGYKSVYLNAFPILRRYGFPAAIFLTVSGIGENKIFKWLLWDDKALKDKATNKDNWISLSWSEIKEMNAGGITFGSHTVSHPHLAKLDRDKIGEELRNSKRQIEENLSGTVNYFSYPVGIGRYGAFDDVTKSELINNSFKMAFISEIGRNNRNSDLYAQKRIAVEEKDSLFDFKCKLVGAYDWVGVAQKTFQRLFKEVD